jgi:hypothetical protein
VRSSGNINDNHSYTCAATNYICVHPRGLIEGLNGGDAEPLGASCIGSPRAAVAPWNNGAA